MLKIYDGRKDFYQWDLDQKLIVSDPTINEVHFCNQTEDCALVCEVYNEGEQRLVNVPNILLQDIWPIKAYAHCDCATKTCQTFEVITRSKPTDYVYTETEVKRWEELYERLDELELGARAIIDVEELLTEDINTALLYRTAEGVYWYDGEWHKVTDESDLNEINDRIDTVESIAKGAGQARSFGDYATMVEALNALPSDVYKIGQSIMIVTLNVPDLWVSAIAEESVPYTYVDDETFAEAIKTNGSVQVGYYVLSALETQKVDLTDYVKNTDWPENTVAGGKPGVVGLNYATSCGLRVETSSNGKKFLSVYAGNSTDVLRRNGACVVTIGNMDDRVKTVITGAREKNQNGAWVKSYGNQPTLTDEEKASAAKWLGVPNAYEIEDADMALDIPFTSGYNVEINPELYATLVSDKTFTIEELKSGASPFYLEAKDASNNTTQVFRMSEATLTEGNGYIKISKTVPSSNGNGTCYDVNAYIVYDHTVANFGYAAPPSNGIYFALCYYHNMRFERLYREGKRIKFIDNGYLDLENNSVIKALMARIEALENK